MSSYLVNFNMPGPDTDSHLFPPALEARPFSVSNGFWYLLVATKKWGLFSLLCSSLGPFPTAVSGCLCESSACKGFISICVLRTMSCGSNGLSSWLEEAYRIYVRSHSNSGLSIESEDWGIGQTKETLGGVCMKSYGDKFMKANLHSGFIGICT